MYLMQTATHGNEEPFRSRSTPTTSAPGPKPNSSSTAQSEPKPKQLTAKDELSLVWRWQRRSDHRARDTLVRAFQPAIRAVAAKHPGRGLEFDDRVQLGNVGFLIALDKFDIHRRCRLWTYAQGWVRAEITNATAKSSSIVRATTVGTIDM